MQARRLQYVAGMIWTYLYVLLIGNSPVYGEELDLKGLGIQFRILESGEEGPLPLFEDARAEWSTLLKEFPIYTLSYREPMRAVAEGVQNKAGEVLCDCGLFVQIMAQILSGSAKNAVLLPTFENFPEAIACACEVDLAYLRVRNRSAHQKLQSTSLMNKGLWLLPVAEDQYLSLDEEGPRIATQKEWSERIEKGLLCEAKLSHLSNVERVYLDKIIQRGLKSGWSVDRFSAEWPERHRRGLKAILARVRKAPF